MSTPKFTKSLRAAAAIQGFLIVAASGAGKSVVTATASTDLLIGAAGEMGAPASAMLDIDMAGWSKVRFGDDVEFGDPLTSDDQGRAVTATPVAGETVRIIGFAMADAEEGDIADFLIAPGVLATPSGD